MTAPAELLRALAAFVERPGPEHTQIADLLSLPPPDDHAWTQAFLFHLYPYASVHLGDEGMLGGAARDRVAGFFRALDTTPPPECDHLTVLLRAWAELEDRAADDDRAAHAATTLLGEHLSPWLPGYLHRMRALAPAPYRAWAELLEDVLRSTIEERPVPLLLPLHLREAAPLDDPREAEDAGTLVRDLLAPVRCGFILTIADLRRAGRETGLPMRIGERRYVLEQLMGQSVDTTLHWLVEHARSTADGAWGPWSTALPAVSGWWRQRANRTADLLDELAHEAATAEFLPAS